MGNAVAAIDCGTNSTRLLIVDASGEVLERSTIVTRLGEAVDSTGELAANAICRTVDVLRTFRRRMDELGVGEVRMVATSAVRDAANGKTFLAAASSVVGVDAELLSGEEEGGLTLAGVTARTPEGRNGVMVVDIGGGSTELSSARGGQVVVASLTIGSVRLAERYLRHDPPLKSDVEEMVSAIHGEFLRANSRKALPSTGRPGESLIGVAGTIVTLCVLMQDLPGYDRTSIDGCSLRYEDVVHLCDQLLEEPTDLRRRRSSVLEGRADIIPAGAVILREVMSTWRFPVCFVSEADLLDGLVITLKERHQSQASRAGVPGLDLRAQSQCGDRPPDANGGGQQETPPS